MWNRKQLPNAQTIFLHHFHTSDLARDSVGSLMQPPAESIPFHFHILSLAWQPGIFPAIWNEGILIKVKS